MITRKTVKTLILLLLLVPALFVSGCEDKGLAAEKELTLEEIAAQMQQKEDNIDDYSFTLNLNLDFEGETLENEFEVMARKPGMYRILTKRSGKEPEKVEVSNGEYMWTYYPWKNTAIEVKLPETSEPEEKESAEKDSGENSGIGLIGGLLNENRTTLLGTEEVDGRPAYLLGKTPEENGEEEGEDREGDRERNEGGEGEEEGALPGYSEKFWIDKETGMLLRYENYDSNENLTMEYEISNLKINTGIQDSEFEFELPEGATMETREFGKRYPPENLTAPDGDRQIASSLIIGLCS
ncbi:LolA family protein [Methanosarcina sp. Mfa9]|uniref:LolA family protein n=1 Tax=Methanosarcina sp. Mfa9 TaxID=3439063 RepID=UPI003F826634